MAPQANSWERISMMINSISNHSASTLSSGASEIESTAVAADSGPVNVSDSDNISSRAMQIQKLNKEFFADGVFDVSETLVDRLAEYGLIKEGDKERLLSSSFFSKAEKTLAPESELEKLTDSVDSLMDRIAKQDPEGPLLEALGNAQRVIDRLDSFTIGSLDVPQVMNDLRDQVSQSPIELTRQENASLKRVDVVLQLAGMLGAQNVSSTAINSYLQLQSGLTFPSQAKFAQ
jgi:hypothetical protein